MKATIISQDKTINYNDIVDIVANTKYGQQHIKNSNGSVNDIKRGKIQFLLKRKGSDQLETVSLYVDDGIAYVENKTINIVANIREEEQSSNNLSS